MKKLPDNRTKITLKRLIYFMVSQPFLFYTVIGEKNMYVYYNENPRENYHAGDCVIRAVMRVTGESWEKIYTELCAEGFYIGEWGNNNGVWDSYLRQRGFKRHICPNDCPHCYSIADFAAEHPHGTYIAATGTHAVAVVDGNYYDSWNSGGEMPIYYYSKE